MWREKYIRWTWAVVLLNALVSLMQIGFTYGHYLKHEYWLMLISGFFMLFNGYFAWRSYKNLKQMKQELKDHMWQTLKTPSEVLR